MFRRPFLAAFLASGFLALLTAVVDWSRDLYLDGRLSAFVGYFDTGFWLTFAVGGLAFWGLYLARIRSLVRWVAVFFGLWFVFAFVLSGIRFFVTQNHPKLTLDMTLWEALLAFSVLNVFYLATSLAIGAAGWFLMFRVFGVRRATKA